MTVFPEKAVVPLSEDSGVPLYVQLRDQMREKITSGEWREHQQIPTENELALQYNVARTTVRRALADMENRGLLYRKPGRGTFVRAKQVPLRLRRSVSFSQDIISKGMVPSARLILAKVVVAEPGVAEAMGVAVGTPLVRVVRLRFADERPVLINDVTLLAADCPGLESRPELGASQSSVYQIISRDYGMRIEKMKGYIQPILADGQQAKLLEIPRGSAIFKTTVTGTNPEGRPVIHAVDFIRGDWAFDIGTD